MISSDGRRRGQGSGSSQTQLAGFEGPAPAQPNLLKRGGLGVGLELLHRSNDVSLGVGLELARANDHPRA